MTDKIYTTSMGQHVDLGALFIKNENVPAVGNMGVNAAGKKLDVTSKKTDGRQNAIPRTQPGRITNVMRQTPDVTAAAARDRLEKEREEKLQREEARRTAELAAQEASKHQLEPVVLVTVPPVDPTPVHENDVFEDLMFSAEDDDIDPLQLELPQPAVSVEEPTGLAAAIQRASLTRGTNL